MFLKVTEIDFAEDGRICVDFGSLAKRRQKYFDAGQRAAAEAFADSKMGRGCVINNIDQTPAQRQARAERNARTAALFADLERQQAAAG